MISDNFQEIMDYLERMMVNHGEVIHPKLWQGVDVSKISGSKMVEITNVNFGVFGIHRYSPEDIIRQIKPNLPWADDHFNERVSGLPINPGKEWENWPWANSANDHRDSEGKFNHNYMERYWPKYAGKQESNDPSDINRGIRYRYGDLNDVINLLVSDPETRQAYLPVWFPEDTGRIEGRKPCTLGYHFLRRDDYLQVTYYIRSCDMYRHLRDDIYLTVLLLWWVLQKLKKIDFDNWGHIRAKLFRMDIISLHLFENDYIKLFRRKP